MSQMYDKYQANYFDLEFIVKIGNFLQREVIFCNFCHKVKNIGGGKSIKHAGNVSITKVCDGLNQFPPVQKRKEKLHNETNSEKDFEL